MQVIQSLEMLLQGSQGFFAFDLNPWLLRMIEGARTTYLYGVLGS